MSMQKVIFLFRSPIIKTTNRYIVHRQPGETAMSQASTASLLHVCSPSITYMAMRLMEWSQYFTDKVRDGEDIALRCLVQATCARLVYFNLLTVFFALLFKMPWEHFISLRRHRDRLYYLVQFASAFENGITDIASYEKWQASRTLPPQTRSDLRQASTPDQVRCTRLAVYVSSQGETVLQELIEKAGRCDEMKKTLERAETYTAQGSVLRIWYDSCHDSPIEPVLQEFWDKASEDDYKCIMSFPEGDATEVGYYYGPLRLRTYTDFDYDLSQADGKAWRCRDCDNHGNEHGFYREWEAVEQLGGNGHVLSSHFTRHLDGGGIFCGKCGSYDVQDDSTDLSVNNEIEA